MITQAEKDTSLKILLPASLYLPSTLRQALSSLLPPLNSSLSLRARLPLYQNVHCAGSVLPHARVCLSSERDGCRKSVRTRAHTHACRAHLLPCAYRVSDRRVMPTCPVLLLLLTRVSTPARPCDTRACPPSPSRYLSFSFPACLRLKLPPANSCTILSPNVDSLRF